MRENGIEFTDMSEDQEITTSVLRGETSRLTLPHVFVGGRLIGGADEVQAWLASLREA